jgi:teichuronic acid exporter
MSISSIESRAIRGAFWSAVERLGPQLIQFIVSIVLARLLMPEQFGLIGMLSIFMALGYTMMNSGFGSALVQKQDATEVHYNSVFYLNIFLSLLVVGALCIAAPWIAKFYGEPMLSSLTQVLSLNFILNALGLIQSTLLFKRLDFKTLSKASLLANFGSGVVGIGMALAGYGIWSLVAQNVSATLLNTILLWIFNSWRPKRIFSLLALSRLFAFGSRLLASGILDALFNNLYSVVIGKLFLPAELGYYTRAYTVQQLPAETVGRIAGRVTFPLFAEIQDDVARVKNGCRKVLRAISLVHFPLMIGLLVCAKPLVLTLFTDKWSPAVPYLQLLCIVGLFSPLLMANQNVILAKGHSDLYFWLELTRKVLIVILIAFTWRWGIEAIIEGQIVVSILAYILNSYYSGKIVGYGFKSQTRDLLPYLGVACVMGAVVFMLNGIYFAHPAVLLVTQVITGGLIYGLLCLGFRLPVFMDAWNVFQRKIVAVKMPRS